MAKNDAATLVVGAGNFFRAPTGTAIPNDLTQVAGDWENVGNTSIEDIFGTSSEGGEKSVLATLQNPTLRTRYSPRTESFTFNLQQFDEASLRLYYGSNMVDVNEDGTLLGVPLNPTPTEGAFLAVFIDGENVFAFYAPKSEQFRGDDAEISNTEDLASLPIQVTPLKHNDNGWAYAVTPLESVEGGDTGGDDS